MRIPKRWTFATSIVTLTLLAAYWLGEHNATIAPLEDVLVAFPGALVLLFILWRGHRVIAVFAPPLILAASIGTWMLGAKEGGRAKNDCLERCVNVQHALAAYRMKHSRYPASLAELNMRLPGRVFLPPQIVKYRRTDDGYDLWVADGLMSYQGTQSMEFEAHK